MQSHRAGEEVSVHRWARLLVAVALLAALRAQAHWPDTNVTKWVQFPDPKQTGYDVLVGQAAGSLPLIVADDFPCRKTGPISDIHLWTSWLGDKPNPNTPVTLSIWSDVPAITNANGAITPSHPGSMLWQQLFGPGQYAIQAWQTSDEQFWNPDPPPKGNILGPDHMIWQYNFYPTNPFVQRGTPTAPVVYWLAVNAGANTANFGWKTSTNHWNDDAVFGHVDPASGTALGDWVELFDPLAATAPRSLNMAFALTTGPNITNPPPPPPIKWVQYPDQFNGLDISAASPSVVADDFQCTEAGTITNIQVWGSWRDDAQPDPSTTFVLSIWSDVPAGPATVAGTSHPGILLWRETFVPGNYGLTYVTNGTEQWYDPNTGQMVPETKIWLYSFSPQKPFCQKGSTNQPVTYWLSVSAQSANNTLGFGWKTSTNHWSDDAVFGHLDASGTALGDWKELFDPRTGISLDLAFLLKNGPPSADCDNIQRPKWVEYPDPTPNGIDVLATYPKILGDDFLCRLPGSISGITVWGSWLNDLVDTNVTFQLGLWTDVPALPGTTNNYSHPGQLLCSSTFYPPQAVGTSLLRYQYGRALANLQESFFDPDKGGTSGFIGTDTQIWRYDFYPFQPSCWVQRGLPAASQTYWLSLTATPADQNALFGWKTSTNHWNDDGVWGHLSSASGTALGDWKDLHDPRTGQSLDLSLALRHFPVIGINKDLKNTTTATVDGVQIVVAGIHPIIWHYDDAPPWPLFSVSYAGGNTVLQWSGRTVAPGSITHVGFEMGGASVSIVTMKWLVGNTVVGTPIQVNHHMLGNGAVLVLNNDFVSTAVQVTSATIEWHSGPVALDQMNSSSQRTPLGSADLAFPPDPCLPGGALYLQLPSGPAGAQYALFILKLADAQGNPATTDFVLLPLDAAMQPIVRDVALAPGGMLSLTWPTVPDRSYRLRWTPQLGSPNWMDVPTGDLNGDGTDMSVQVPVNGTGAFYQLVLDPQ